MAEAVGIVIGVAGLFSTCLECLDLVDSAKNYEHESEVLIAKLDIQRVRLQTWGEVVGLSTHQNSEESEYLSRQGFGVSRCLEGIRRALTNSRDLIEKYGLIQADSEINAAALTPKPQSRVDRLRQGLMGSIDSVLQGSRHASVGRRLKWAIKDKQRFLTLVEDVKDFVDGLHSIEPAMQPRHKRLVERKIQSLKEPDVLELVAEATNDDYPDWSDTASVALLSQHTTARPAFLRHRSSTHVRDWVEQTGQPERFNSETYPRSTYVQSERAASVITHPEPGQDIASGRVSAAVAKQRERANARAQAAARRQVEEACRGGTLDSCLAFMKPDTDLADLDEYGTTLMHLAAKYGRCDVLEALLDAGADIDMRDAEGMTPFLLIHDSDLLGAQATRRFLIENGADEHAVQMRDV